MEEKKKSTRKKKVEEEISETPFEIEELEKVVEEETKKEVKKSLFTTEEKLYITKLIANGYRPFDIVKKVRFKMHLSEEKLKKLSLNVRTVEQLVKALEG